MSATTALGLAMQTMTPDQIQALSLTQIATLSVSDLEALPLPQLFALWPLFSGIAPSTLASLDVTTFGNLSRKEISVLTTDQIAALTPGEINTMGRAKIRQLSGDQIAAIDPVAFSTLGKNRIAHLSATQIEALTSAQITGFNKREQIALVTEAVATGAISNLSADQTAAFQSIKPGAVEALDDQTIAGLTVGTFDALFANRTFRLGSLNGVSVADLQSLNAGQFGQLNGFYLNELGAATLSQLDPTSFTADQVSLFTASTISGLSTTFIDGLSAQALGAITTTAIAGLSVAQLQSLSAAQLGDFSIAQIQAMNAQQSAVVAAGDPLVAQAASLEVNGVLPFSGALTLLQDVAAQGITAANLQQLQLVDARVMTSDNAQTFGVDDAIAVSPSVQQLFHNVVSGLSATTTQAQLNGLIGQWFLGGRRPEPAERGKLAAGLSAELNAALRFFGRRGAGRRARGCARRFRAAGDHRRDGAAGSRLYPAADHQQRQRDGRGRVAGPVRLDVRDRHNATAGRSGRVGGGGCDQRDRRVGRFAREGGGAGGWKLQRARRQFRRPAAAVLRPVLLLLGFQSQHPAEPGPVADGDRRNGVPERQQPRAAGRQPVRGGDGDRRRQRDDFRL